MLTKTEHLYIVKDTAILNGEPIISGTRTPVRAIVEMWRQGIDPQGILRSLPHLSLAQVFNALSARKNIISRAGYVILRPQAEESPGCGQLRQRARRFFAALRMTYRNLFFYRP